MYLLLIGNFNAIVHCQKHFVSFLNLKHNIMMNQMFLFSKLFDKMNLQQNFKLNPTENQTLFLIPLSSI